MTTRCSFRPFGHRRKGLSDCHNVMAVLSDRNTVLTVLSVLFGAAGGIFLSLFLPARTVSLAQGQAILLLSLLLVGMLLLCLLSSVLARIGLCLHCMAAVFGSALFLRTYGTSGLILCFWFFLPRLVIHCRSVFSLARGHSDLHRLLEPMLMLAVLFAQFFLFEPLLGSLFPLL